MLPQLNGDILPFEIAWWSVVGQDRRREVSVGVIADHSRRDEQKGAPPYPGTGRFEIRHTNSQYGSRDSFAGPSEAF